MAKPAHKKPFGRPPEFRWHGAAVVAMTVVQLGSIRAAEDYLRPARTTIRRWAREHPEFRILLAFARGVPALARKAMQAEREGLPDEAEEFAEWANEYYGVVLHVGRRCREALEDSLLPAFDAEMRAYLRAEAKRWKVKA